MKVVISSQGNSLDSPVDPRFGRCAYFVMVDTDNDTVLEAVANPAGQAMGGAGPMAAQKIGDMGAEAVITGNLGPRAADSLTALNIKVYRVNGGTGKEAIEALKAGKLADMGGATVEQHFGMKK